MIQQFPVRAAHGSTRDVLISSELFDHTVRHLEQTPDSWEELWDGLTKNPAAFTAFVSPIKNGCGTDSPTQLKCYMEHTGGLPQSWVNVIDHADHCPNCYGEAHLQQKNEEHVDC